MSLGNLLIAVRDAQGNEYFDSKPILKLSDGRDKDGKALPGKSTVILDETVYQTGNTYPRIEEYIINASPLDVTKHLRENSSILIVTRGKDYTFHIDPVRNKPINPASGHGGPALEFSQP